MRAAAAACALLLAGPAAATPEYLLPTLFDVEGVAAGDVLNVRAEPDASSAVLGALEPDAERVEVTEHDATGRWGRVNLGERSGWVAMRFLAYRTDVWEPGRLPEGLRCLGTEPFWSLSFAPGEAVLETPEATVAFGTRQVLDTGFFRDPRRAVTAQDGERRLTAVIRPAACGDGMSERAYGLIADVVLEEADGARLFVGCCSIAP